MKKYTYYIVLHQNTCKHTHAHSNVFVISWNQLISVTCNGNASPQKTRIWTNEGGCVSWVGAGGVEEIQHAVRIWEKDEHNKWSGAVCFNVWIVWWNRWHCNKENVLVFQRCSIEWYKVWLMHNSYTTRWYRKRQRIQ